MLHLGLSLNAALLLAVACCVQASSPASIQTCEHRRAKIRCGARRIHVLAANYGRTDRGVCASGQRISQITKTNCVLPKTLQEMARRCNGRTTCYVRASNTIFTDPCYGTFKYLQVTYVCLPKKSSVICEHQKKKLYCGMDRIKVTAANYGRKNTDFCSAGRPMNEVTTTNCILPSTQQKMASRCDGRSLCSASASNSVFGDPCVGTFKYLEVTYICVPPIRSTVACEGHVATLECAHGVIKVHSANYGRHNRYTCFRGRPPYQLRNTNCSHSSTKVANSCNGKRSCSIRASNSVFGDPCRGTFKYLDVKYYCLH